MNVIIIEDEKLAAEKLTEMLGRLDPAIAVMAQIPSVEASVRWLVEQSPDLIFMDIQLADGLSFEIFDRVEVRAPIIFTTAYDEYALRAFKVNSIDYLLKPVRMDDLRGAMAKFRELRTPQGKQNLDELLRSLKEGGTAYKKRFLIQLGEKLHKVETAQIAYFYALEKGVFLVTGQRETLPVDFTLDALEEILDPERFFRINRKMIVACDAIRQMVAFSRSRIKLELSPPEPKSVEALVSVERSRGFKEWMDR